MAMKSETVKKAEKLVQEMMGGNDASHDAAHALRVRDLALSLAREEQLLDSSLQIVCFIMIFFLWPDWTCWSFSICLSVEAQGNKQIRVSISNTYQTALMFPGSSYLFKLIYGLIFHKHSFSAYFDTTNNNNIPTSVGFGMLFLWHNKLI